MKIKKIISIIIVTLLFTFILAGTALADVYVSDEYLELEAGQSTYVSIVFDNAAGSFSVSSSGSVYANGGDFLDNDSSGIDISATGVGPGTVVITLDDVATYDDEDLSGTEFVIEVNVVESSSGETDYGKGEDENAPEKTNSEEEKKTEEKTSKLDVKIDEKEYTILSDLKDVELPKGFSEQEDTFEGEKIKVLQYKDSIKLYALKNKADKTFLFYTYDENTKTFKQPLSMTQGKRTYYFLGIPEGSDINGYQIKDVSINGETIPALISNYSGMEDYSYVYAMNDGEEGFYCIDNKENTIQRVSKFSIPLDDHEKQLEAKKVSVLDNKMVLIAGAIALAIIIFLLILLIVTKKKYNEALEDNYDKQFDIYEESIPETDEVMEENADFDDPIDYEDTIVYEKVEDDDLDDIFFDDLE